MVKRYTIQVRHYLNGASRYNAKPEDIRVIETIQRVLRAEQIGNFNPLFCTYKGKHELVSSDAGDLSDPFRREQAYEKSLFIVPKPA